MAAPWGPNEYQQLVKLAYIFGGNASEIARNWIGREQEEEQLRGRLKQLVLYEVNRASYLKPVFKEREAKIGKTLTSFHEFIQKLKDEEEEKEEAAQVDMLLLEARIEEGYRRELELRELHEYEHKFSVTNANQHYYHVNIDVEARQAEARALIEDRSRLRGEVSQMKVLQARRRTLTTPPKPHHYSPYYRREQARRHGQNYDNHDQYHGPPYAQYQHHQAHEYHYHHDRQDDHIQVAQFAQDNAYAHPPPLPPHYQDGKTTRRALFKGDEEH